MATDLDTSKVANRRTLKFASIDEVLADVDRLASYKEVRALGNWSSGQVVQHLAMTMKNSIDGFESFVPAPMRLFLRLVMKRRFLTRPMPAGFKLPARATSMLPAAISFDEAVKNFREAHARLKAESRRAPHPAFGPMTIAEWNQIHCRHSELHLSFLVPVEP